jgi:tetratricopeptide (TPR) repeat protein
MTEHNQKLEPSRFDLNAGPGAETGKASPEKANAAATDANKARLDAGSGSQKMTALGLGVLILVAALVFFWLPERVATPEIEVPLAAPQKSSPATSANTASPWSDAQLGKQRKEAQEVLAVLLEEQFALDEIAVTEWAPEEFAAAQAQATRGDELYRQQEYIEAAAAYQQGLDDLRALSARAPAAFEQLVQEGQLALDNNQAAAALQAFELAIKMQPDSTIAAHGLKRAGSLESVLALLDAAREARAAAELETAQDLLSQALELDPEHAQAKAELAETRREITRRNFNRAMTAGYRALDQGDYDLAEKQFLAAQRIMPSARETENALLDARTSRTTQQIDNLQEQATAAERNEQWQQAANAYRAILGIDESVVFARTGQMRSKTRADMDARLQKIITKPERLSDPTVYSQTQYLLAEAGKIQQPGPRFRQQLATISTLMEQAVTPIPVLLQSDEKTDVTVYRVAHLGTFSRQQLELKPGTYTAVGVRSGYRDVRQKFTLSHDQTSPIIEIRCTDPI